MARKSTPSVYAVGDFNTDYWFLRIAWLALAFCLAAWLGSMMKALFCWLFLLAVGWLFVVYVGWPLFKIMVYMALEAQP